MGTQPYLCPVCKGKTNVKKGFYSDEPERTKCRACVNGVVYGVTNDYYWSTIPLTTPYAQSPSNLSQCSACGAWYSGTHQCMGKYWTTPTYPTGSNPPSVSEVERVFGSEYLHPGMNK